LLWQLPAFVFEAAEQVARLLVRRRGLVLGCGCGGLGIEASGDLGEVDPLHGGEALGQRVLVLRDAGEALPRYVPLLQLTAISVRTGCPLDAMSSIRVRSSAASSCSSSAWGEFSIRARMSGDVVSGGHAHRSSRKVVSGRVPKQSLAVGGFGQSAGPSTSRWPLRPTAEGVPPVRVLDPHAVA
jgi:hypothetical protein